LEKNFSVYIFNMSYLIGEEFYCIPLKHELRRACTYTFTSEE
jgi:hypothetical protein